MQRPDSSYDAHDVALLKYSFRLAPYKTEASEDFMAQGPILEAFHIGMQWRTFGPFLFCAHHDDDFPAANDDMSPKASLAGRQIGSDFAPNLPWRMYHGQTVPGFPAHPHRGFETITIVRDGLIDHFDSLGATARFGHGDVQWMTAGAGIVHSEMFPLVHTDKGNRTELFQVWLNLPAKSKMAPAHFQMIWGNELPVSQYIDKEGRKTDAVHITGDALFKNRPLDKARVPAPPDSWASDEANDVRIVTLKMEPNARVELPAIEKGIVRSLYYFVGNGITLNGVAIPAKTGMRLNEREVLEIVNGNDTAELLLLEGRPINEPVVQHGPFVMNSEAEIRQTIRDYQTTGFGGWPWGKSDPTQDRTRGRFARYADGREEEPPV